jgi:uncharacterized protein (DUF433 family)
MNYYIQVDHQICGGKPVIRGTRIMVKNILGMVAGGYTIDQIVKAYPELTVDKPACSPLGGAVINYR